MSETLMRRIGWGLSFLVALFLIGASALPKLAGMEVAKATTVQLQWPDMPLMAIGVLEAVLAVLYLVPVTALLASVLAMGLLGGAIATNLHAHMPMGSNTLFGVYLGTVMWLGLILRDPKIRAVFPLVR